jgi:hypothetical protein
MGQPSTIYKPGKLNYVWNYLSSTLDNFKAKLLGYRTYKAFLTQTNTDDPVATVVENTLGLKLDFQYDSPGVYYGFTDNDLFNSPTETIDGRKIEVTITPSSSLDPTTTSYIYSAYPVFFFVIGISVWDLGLANYQDNVMGQYCSVTLEIKVYNK